MTLQGNFFPVGHCRGKTTEFKVHGIIWTSHAVVLEIQRGRGSHSDKILKGNGVHSVFSRGYRCN